MTLQYQWLILSRFVALLALIAFTPEAKAQADIITEPKPPEQRTLTNLGTDTRSAWHPHSFEAIPRHGHWASIVATLTKNEKLTYRSLGDYSHNFDLYARWYPTGEIVTVRGYSSRPGRAISISQSGVSKNFATYHASSYPATIQSSDFRDRIEVTAMAGSISAITLMEASGDVTYFSVNGCANRPFARPIYRISKSGHRLDFHYDNYIPSSGPCGRLVRVDGNDGFSVQFQYDSSFASNVSQVCIVNHAISNNCVGSASFQFNGSGFLRAAIVASGNSIHFGNSYNSSGAASAEYTYERNFYHEGSSQPYKTVNYVRKYGREFVSSVSLIDGNSESYAWNEVWHGEDPSEREWVGGIVTNQLGNTDQYGYTTWFRINTGEKYVSESPTSYVDQIGRTTITNQCHEYYLNWVSYCAPGPVREIAFPDGNSVSFQWSGGRLVKQTATAALGSGLADIVQQWTYNCSVSPICAKPLTMTDARGGLTEYAYDPAHGGLLREAKPADAQGVRAVRRLSYVQRHAWVRSSGGGFVHAGPAIWLLAQERTCRTTATVGEACAGGAADEVVTSYEYGPDSGPNNLFLRGMAVSADGQTLRTCYGYDGRGNRISETKPAAGLAVCP